MKIVGTKKKYSAQIRQDLMLIIASGSSKAQFNAISDFEISKS